MQVRFVRFNVPAVISVLFVIVVPVLVYKYASRIPSTDSPETQRLASAGFEFSRTGEGKVTGFRFNGQSLSKQTLTDLKSLTSVSSVNLDGTVCSDDMLDTVASWPNLQSLSLSGCRISDSQL